jgi:hypothetical protein
MPAALSFTTVVTVADALSELVESGGLTPPCLVMATAREVAIRPLEDQHPLDAIVGMVAPSTWRAFGVVTDAWYRSVAGPPDEPDLGPVAGEGLAGSPRGEAVLVHVVDRLGSSHTTLCHSGQRIVEHSSSGPLADACRRVFGLPTGPCPPSDELWAFLWLDAVLAAAAVGDLPRRRQWRSVAALHPFVRIVGPDAIEDAAPSALTVDRLVDWGRQLTMFLPWPVLRRRAQAGTLPLVPELTPAQVDWFDDAAFARFVTSAYPHWRDLRVSLEGLVTPSTAVRLDEVLASWDLPVHHAW